MGSRFEPPPPYPGSIDGRDVLLQRSISDLRVALDAGTLEDSVQRAPPREPVPHVHAPPPLPDYSTATRSDSRRERRERRTSEFMALVCFFCDSVLIFLEWISNLVGYSVLVSANFLSGITWIIREALKH